MRTLRASASDDQQRKAFRLIAAGLSLARSCEEVDAAFRIAASSLRTKQREQGTQAAGQGTQAAALDVACKRSDMFGAFELSGEEMLQRRGLGDRLFSDTVSSLEAPIQVCGLRGALTRLTNLTCDDGSRPWGRDLKKAHQSRRGSMIGHRTCGAAVEPVPIDLYEAPCSEKRYDFYIDMYECGPGERFRRSEGGTVIPPFQN